MKPKTTIAKALSAMLLAASIAATLPAAALAATEPDPANDPPPLTQPNPDYPDIIPLQMEIEEISSFNHNAALDSDGRLWQWGHNGQGQLANGEYGEPTTLTTVDFSSPIVKAMVSWSASYVLLENGDFYFSGSDTSSNSSARRFVKVNGLGKVVDFVADRRSTLVKLDDGRVYGWGANTAGVLATGKTLEVKNPIVITAIANKNLPVLAGNSAYRLEDDGSVTVWGSGINNALGLAAQTGASLTPVRSAQIESIRNIAATAPYSLNDARLAITDGNELLVWGANTYGYLGTGGTEKLEEPTINTTVGQVAGVAGTFTASFIVKPDGTVWCAGKNTDGILGLGLADEEIEMHTFTQIPLDANIVHVETGYNHVFAQADNGDWWAWGGNVYGEITPSGSEHTSINSPVLIFTADGTTTPVDPDPDTHNVTIIVKYLDGAHPDEVTTYAVPQGAEFFEGYTVQPGYQHYGVSLYSLTYNVDADAQTVYISEVNQDITVELEYKRVAYNVEITTRYADGALPDDVQTHAVPPGQGLETTFEMLDGYKIGGVETNILGVNVRGDKTISIRAVNENVYITITLSPE